MHSSSFPWRSKISARRSRKRVLRKRRSLAEASVSPRLRRPPPLVVASRLTQASPEEIYIALQAGHPHRPSVILNDTRRETILSANRSSASTMRVAPTTGRLNWSNIIENSVSSRSITLNRRQ